MFQIVYRFQFITDLLAPSMATLELWARRWLGASAGRARVQGAGSPGSYRAWEVGGERSCGGKSGWGWG